MDGGSNFGWVAADIGFDHGSGELGVSGKAGLGTRYHLILEKWDGMFFFNFASPFPFC